MVGPIGQQKAMLRLWHAFLCTSPLISGGSGEVF